MNNNKSQVIAFYLPQYHPTLHNDVWWGKGFTEWTNVAKAKPLFHGHYQPKIPADLGFYDLRLPLVREQQVQLAKEAGVTGFCYYHYWFGNGEQELEMPFNEVVTSGKPDFPFCLCWANETWSRKFWDKDGNVSGKEDLAVQKYLGEVDDRQHFLALLNAFKDKRYIRIDGRMVFMIYKPLLFEDVTRFIRLWNSLSKDNGLDGFYFVAYSTKGEAEYDQLKRLGFDAVCSCGIGYGKQTTIEKYYRKIVSLLTNRPRTFSYKKMIPQFVGDFEQNHDDVFPTLIPNWDHTPRSKDHGYLYTNSTPQLFYEHAVDVLSRIAHKPMDKRITFLKSWNEWGEGNYMEPDLKFGHGYIDALRDAIRDVADEAERGGNNE